MNKIHYRSLKVVHNSYYITYEELLEINKSVTIHQKHLQFLAIEVFKSIMHLNPEFMWSLLTLFRLGYFGAPQGWGGLFEPPPLHKS